MILEPVAPFRNRDVVFRAAAEAWELAAYHRLRRRVFCDEQRLFAGDDRDAIDARATALLAVGRLAGVVDDVVAGVRIWEAEPGAWWGGRLVVHADHRGTAGIASGLIRLAVATACRRGARSFRATVQVPNVALFVRLGWTVVAAVDVRGAPHALMAADLAAFGGGAS
jgi:putative N-acetyltransferase (TIGR04045 family)